MSVHTVIDQHGCAIIGGRSPYTITNKHWLINNRLLRLRWIGEVVYHLHIDGVDFLERSGVHCQEGDVERD